MKFEERCVNLLNAVTKRRLWHKGKIV